MTSVHIPARIRAEMLAHAQAEAPNECCGLLIGEGSLIDESLPARNVDPEPTRRYLLDPREHIAANRRLRGTPRQVLGCYHSHPRSPAVPSATDLAEALYPDFVWVIVSLAAAKEDNVAAYRLTGAGFVPVTIVAAL